VFQAIGIFSVSVVLGLTARYAGLAAAMLVHASVDVIGLYSIRRIVRQQTLA
jgi:hypothetical protein